MNHKMLDRRILVCALALSALAPADVRLNESNRTVQPGTTEQTQIFGAVEQSQHDVL